MIIERFRGDYYPFSNMYPLQHMIPTDRGINVPTSEHAYMANRFVNLEEQQRVAKARALCGNMRSYGDALAAKEIAHSLIEHGSEQIFNDDFARVALMHCVTICKLERNPAIAQLLISTGEQDIQEGNSWGDQFWGISPIGSGQGQNHLGRIYMELRETFK